MTKTVLYFNSLCCDSVEMMWTFSSKWPQWVSDCTRKKSERNIKRIHFLCPMFQSSGQPWELDQMLTTPEILIIILHVFKHTLQWLFSQLRLLHHPKSNQVERVITVIMLYTTPFPINRSNEPQQKRVVADVGNNTNNRNHVLYV